MLAVTATSTSSEDPLAGLSYGEHPDPSSPPGWVVVRVKAAALNHHDLWTLRGVGVDAARLPIVLGCDAAGVTEDGREVVVHAVIGDPDAGDGDETLDPARSLLSERYDGTLAELVAVPERNLLPKPAALSWVEAACLPTAWLTAYRMLFTWSGLQPGGRVLIQGAGGGVATAAIQLARAAGYVVYVTSRDAARRDRAVELGAHVAVPSGDRLPSRVDAVIETVGAATWDHSIKSLEPGGTIVVSGATSGADPPADLRRIFFKQLRVVGSTMGTRAELASLLRFVQAADIHPQIDGVISLAEARTGFEQMMAGDVFGKIVFTV
jgi:NADPH:quinone reductase-like Zn-dependent oxidoreductase